LLADAWQAHKLGGYKLMASLQDKGGAVYVNKVEADELLRSRDVLTEDARALMAAYEVAGQPMPTSYDKPLGIDDGVAADQVSRLAVVALSQMNNSISELLDVMTRVAKACEGMASAWGEKQQSTECDKSQEEQVNGGFSVFEN
jgi:hypothetical protein